MKKIITYPEILSKKFNNLKHVIKQNKEDKHIIKIKNKSIGKDFVYMLGPCAVENYNMYEETAKHLKKLNVSFIRGGAFKLRTSPYDYEGLKEEGIDIIKEISDKYDLISLTEVPSVSMINKMKDKIDILVVGARNMQNVALLKALSKVKNPIILKRNPGATLLEFLASAEYIIELGNPNVILCERGIRSYEYYNRYTLDIAGAAALLDISRLPVIIDPSHAAGRKELIIPLARAAKAISSDGLMVEFHKTPKLAKSDSMQALDFKEVERMVLDCEKIKF